MSDPVALAPLRDISLRAERRVAHLIAGLDPVAALRDDLAASHRRGLAETRPDDLRLAVAIGRAGLDVLHTPDHRAAVFHDIALSLQALGDLQQDPTITAAALDAFCDALDTAPAAPEMFRPAEALNDAACLHRRIGTRTQDPAHFEEAVALHRAAAEALAALPATEDRHRAWAATQHSIGVTLGVLSDLPDQRHRYPEIIDVFRAALDVYSRDDHPTDWAFTMSQLGLTLHHFSLLTHDIDMLREAVSTLRSTLTAYGPDSAPQHWALTQHRLGCALQTLATLCTDTDILQNAAAAFRAALPLRMAAAPPLDAATTQLELGNTLQDLGRALADPDPIHAALDAYAAAQAVFARYGSDRDRAGTLFNTGRSHAALFEMTRDPVQFQQGECALSHVIAAKNAAWIRPQALDALDRLRSLRTHP